MIYEEARNQVAVANRILSQVGLCTGVTTSLGHASMRIPEAPDRFYVKGRGYDLDAVAAMRPEDMVLCDLDGFRIDGPEGVAQCQEVKIHSCIYRTYPEVQSIVHVHPRYVILMSVLDETIRPMCQEGVQLVKNPLAVYPHVKTIQSDEEGMDVANLLGKNKAVLLQGHGAVTTGSSLSESVTNMMYLEEQARMNYYALLAKGTGHPYIPDASIDEMTDRPRTIDLPHFQWLKEWRGGSSGWSYFVDVAVKEMAAE